MFIISIILVNKFILLEISCIDSIFGLLKINNNFSFKFFEFARIGEYIILLSDCVKIKISLNISNDGSSSIVFSSGINILFSCIDDFTSFCFSGSISIFLLYLIIKFYFLLFKWNNYIIYI